MLLFFNVSFVILLFIFGFFPFPELALILLLTGPCFFISNNLLILLCLLLNSQVIAIEIS